MDHQYIEIELSDSCGWHVDGSSWTVGRAVDCTRLESERPYRFRGSNPLPSAESAWLDCPVTSIRDLFGLNYTDSPFSLCSLVIP